MAKFRFNIPAKSIGGMSVRIDNASFNRAFEKNKEAVEKAMFYASGYALSAAKDHATNAFEVYGYAPTGTTSC